MATASLQNEKSEKIKIFMYSISEKEVSDVLQSPDAPKTTDDENGYIGIECAICYKRINTNVFICTEPCNKMFHPSCLEKVIEQTEETFETDDENEEPKHSCCYCRREYDMENYYTEVYLRELKNLRASGYYIGDAVSKLKEDGILTDGEYEIYMLHNTDDDIKPKNQKIKRSKIASPHIRVNKHKSKNVMNHRMGCGMRKR